MRILVTGGAGFIGSHLVEHFAANGDEVTVIDSLRTGYEKNVAGFKIKFIRGSVEEKKLVGQAAKNIDYIFHLAAMVSVTESMSNPNLAESINVQGTLNVLESAAKNKVKKVVFASSCAVYGDSPVIPKKEDMLPEPKSPYADTKLSGEHYCQKYENDFGLATVMLRFFNVFGPRQDPKSQYAAAIPIFVSNAVQNKDIVIFGDGEQTRDFVYVKDVVSALLVAQEKAAGVFNVASGNVITINRLAEKILELTGSRSKIVYQPERSGDIKHSSADISRITKIGFYPKYTLDTALQETINFFRKK